MALTKFNAEQLSIFESQLDDLLAQHNQPTPPNTSDSDNSNNTSNKPSKLARAGKTLANVAATATDVATNAAYATRDVFNTPALGGGGVVKKVDLFRPTSDRDNTKAPDQHSTFVNKDPIEDFREYAKRVTKGKVAQQSTGTPEVDTLLKKLKVFKRK